MIENADIANSHSDRVTSSSTTPTTTPPNVLPPFSTLHLLGLTSILWITVKVSCRWSSVHQMHSHSPLPTLGLTFIPWSTLKVSCRWIYYQSLYIKCNFRIASFTLTCPNLRFKLYLWHWRRSYVCTLLPSLSQLLYLFVSPGSSQVGSHKCQVPAEKVWHSFKNPFSILHRPIPQF